MAGSGVSMSGDDEKTDAQPVSNDVMGDALEHHALHLRT
jgi:hypothetical protein